MTPPHDELSLSRVLVVDDQSHVRSWVRMVLRTMGITDVTEAADGRDALTAVTQPGKSFDLILCDLRMPERDGIETIRAFGALGLESAIVIMSVEEERVIETAGTLAEVQGLRMLGIISKPLTAEKLQPILTRMREVPRQHRTDAAAAPGRDFANAFARAELLFLYQPKVWMRTGKFAGAEALVRWKHPELGLFQPASFVPAMDGHDEYGAALIDFSLKEAIACSGRWHQAGRELRVAITRSPKDAWLRFPPQKPCSSASRRVRGEEDSFMLNRIFPARIDEPTHMAGNNRRSSS